MRLAYSRGDTIIEVIFAIVIFSFIAISSLTIMNKGVAIGEKALEISLVRQQINAQAEVLRFIHEASVVTPASPHALTWTQLVSAQGQAAASEYGVNNGECLLPAGATYHPFVLNARTAQIWSNPPSIEAGADTSFPPYPQVIYNDDSSIQDAYGLWIESVPSSVLVARRFVDFHIRACWAAPGSAVPMTIATIVRLYDPS